MSARQTVIGGIVLILLLASSLVRSWGHQVEVHSADAVERGRIAGLSTIQLNGVDHLVERYYGTPGLTTVAAQLEALEVALAPEDQVTAIPDPALGIGSWIEITRATPVSIIDGRDVREVRTWSTTLAQLLEEERVTIDDDDKIVPSVDTLLVADMSVAITRVGVSEEIESESIDFKRLVQDDADLEKGVTRIEQQGRVGLRLRTYQVTRENGEVTSRRLAKTEVSREPINEVTVRGTKVISYGSGEATWYRWKPGGAAHNTLPRGTKVLVVNVSNGKSTVVTINDRGIQGSAIIDLDSASFAALAPLGAGRINVRLEKYYEP